MARKTGKKYNGVSFWTFGILIFETLELNTSQFSIGPNKPMTGVKTATNQNSFFLSGRVKRYLGPAARIAFTAMLLASPKSNVCFFCGE